MRLMLFEPNHHGHHPIFVRHLVEYWCEREQKDELYAVVSPKFMQRQPTLADLPVTQRHPELHFISLTSEEVAALRQAVAVPQEPTFQELLERKLSPNSYAMLMWNLIEQYATCLDVQHCLIMFLDACVLPIAAGLLAPCSFSGIAYSPTPLNAPTLGHAQRPAEQAARVKQKWVLARLLAHPQLRTLFVDSYASEQFKSPSPKLVHLPIPARHHSVSKTQAAALRARLGVKPNRQVLLVFGDLSERKGIFKILETIPRLPAEWGAKVCLIFAGKIRADVQARLEAQIATLGTVSAIQIIEQYGFVPEEQVQTYFEIADVVLVPYQRHAQTSSVLVLAAAAHKPVLSTNLGYMGKAVEEYELGLAVDTAEPNEIARGLARLLSAARENSWNTAGMRRFAEQNSADKFARVIFERLTLESERDETTA